MNFLAASLTFSEPFTLVCAFVVGVLAVTRVTRLIVDDQFPPVRWMADQYVRHASEKWEVLVECPWCVSVYVALVDVIWAWSTDLHWTFWFGNTWAAVSWLAAYLTLRDTPPDNSD